MNRDELLRLDNQLCFLLYATFRKIAGLYRPLLDKLGITYPQYLVMLVLWEHGPLSVGEIGARLHLDSGTLTPLLKRLEKQALVHRNRSAEDERRVTIRLTEAGAAMKASAYSIPEAMICNSGVTASQYWTLKKELDSLLAQIPTSGQCKKETMHHEHP
ncbi:MAG: MarR family winged helix-turn-helix transcriptional regulator [Thermodesulfobacteriota bacterium]